MRSFMSPKYASLEAYTPGEQPQDMQYVKLNTNESPFPPSPEVLSAVAEEAGKLNLYCDPECKALRAELAALYGLKPENILPVNGSDEALYLAFAAFADKDTPVAYPNISYGFYPVYADVHHLPSHVIELKGDFSIDYRDYCGLNEMVVIANPNAPTGMTLSLWEIEEIIKSNPDNVVLIDEAYVDFGAESCVDLIRKYDNLLVCQTFSKSRSMAGARLGVALASEGIIRDMNTLKYSINPYNVNRMSQRAGIAAVQSNDYYMANCRTIAENRAYTVEKLTELGFTALSSKANFIFVTSDAISGGEYYEKLKAMGVLVRHFTKPTIANFCRITIGTREQMDVLLEKTKRILAEKGC